MIWINLHLKFIENSFGITTVVFLLKYKFFGAELQFELRMKHQNWSIQKLTRADAMYRYFNFK
jgi:hypothetical protein